MYTLSPNFFYFYWGNRKIFLNQLQIIPLTTTIPTKKPGFLSFFLPPIREKFKTKIPNWPIYKPPLAQPTFIEKNGGLLSKGKGLEQNGGCL